MSHSRPEILVGWSYSEDCDCGVTLSVRPQFPLLQKLYILNEAREGGREGVLSGLRQLNFTVKIFILSLYKPLSSTVMSGKPFKPSGH